MRNIIDYNLFEHTVENNYKLVYKICYDILKDKGEAENISQEAFLNLYKNFTKYSNLDTNQLKNLICKITINKCRDYLKSKQFKIATKSIELDSTNSKIIDEYLIDEHLIKKEKQMLIKKAVNELKSPYKEVVIEYYFNELSLDEIAIKLKRDKSVIKTQLYRSKKILRENLKGGGLFE